LLRPRDEKLAPQPGMRPRLIKRHAALRLMLEQAADEVLGPGAYRLGNGI
jgi:hypothetical protein